MVILSESTEKFFFNYYKNFTMIVLFLKLLNDDNLVESDSHYFAEQLAGLKVHLQSEIKKLTKELYGTNQIIIALKSYFYINYEQECWIKSKKLDDLNTLVSDISEAEHLNRKNLLKICK